MKKGLFYKIIVFLILQIQVTLFYAQTNASLEPYYTWYDTTIGIGNSGLYNGVVFTKKYETENGSHQFYLDNKYMVGSLIYEGQPYFDVNIKYDVYEDEVIVKLPNTVGHLFVNLIKEKITEFTIDGRQFINAGSDNNTPSNELRGFYEVLHRTSGIVLLKKHYKARTEYLSNARKYYDFSIKNQVVIYYKNNYYQIDSKKDVIQLFPELKKSISMFYRKENRLLKSDEDAFFTILIKSIITPTLTNTDFR